MMDEKKVKALELLVAGEHTKVDIAKIVGVERSTLYNWINNPEFVAELDKRLQEVKDLAKKEFDAKLPRAINEYWELAMTTQDSRTKESVLYKWIERSLGKVATRIDLEASTKQTNNTVDEDIIDAEIDEIEES